MKRRQRQIVIPRTSDGLYYIAAGLTWCDHWVRQLYIDGCTVNGLCTRTMAEILAATDATVQKFNVRAPGLTGLYKVEWRPNLMAVVASEFAPEHGSRLQQLRANIIELVLAKLKAGQYR
jgi:hypothetical protein